MESLLAGVHEQWVILFWLGCAVVYGFWAAHH